MGKIVYITANTPLGAGETFVLTEMLALKKAGVDLLIIPRDISERVFHEKAKTLLTYAQIVPWFSFAIVKSLCLYILRYPYAFLRLIYRIALGARSIRIALKNLVVFSKAVHLSELLKKKDISHIHAHWGSTTSTLAYVIANITGIPWSFTVHRWDIPENNILREKVRNASFVRCIDKNGRAELNNIVKEPNLEEKIKVIHMGVDLSETIKELHRNGRVFTFICPANLVPKKGHRYLFEACRILVEKNLRFKCFIAGDGPLERELLEMVGVSGLNSHIEFLGRITHERLFGLYSGRLIDSVVLLSIVADDGQKEGIPVALIEAMSYGIPVISTNTGGIHELIGDGSGIMVEERDPQAIADAIERLMNDTTLYDELAERGRQRVMSEFNADTVAGHLSKLFSTYTRSVSANVL